jgi:hypothetical protein
MSDVDPEYEHGGAEPDDSSEPLANDRAVQLPDEARDDLDESGQDDLDESDPMETCERESAGPPPSAVADPPWASGLLSQERAIIPPSPAFEIRSAIDEPPAPPPPATTGEIGPDGIVDHDTPDDPVETVGLASIEPVAEELGGLFCPAERDTLLCETMTGHDPAAAREDIVSEPSARPAEMTVPACGDEPSPAQPVAEPPRMAVSNTALDPTVLAAGATPARSPAMSQSSSQLSQELAAMSDRFSELGERMLTAARQLHAPGTPPAEDLLEAVGTCRREFSSLRDRTRELAESFLLEPPPADQIKSLQDVTGLLDHVAQAEIFRVKTEVQRQRAVAILDRILLLSHRTTPDFPALRECHEKAQGLRALVSEAHWSSLHPETERLADGDHHFANLLTLIENPDDLSDEMWADLHEDVSRVFGRQLAAAAARTNLVPRKD